MSLLDDDAVFGALIRNRSGQYSGEIDYIYRAHRVIGLQGRERQDLLNTTYALYQALCRDLNGRAAEDAQASAPAASERK
jgi:hypothetical protein